MILLSTSLYLMFINNVTVTSSSYNLQLLLRIKFATKRVFWISNIWKTRRMMLFFNFFIERPSYLVLYVDDGLLQVGYQWCR